ncbi:hypothetical protein P3H15_48265 [Rhodococcus sp. T2V]|uniref:hypothetical protein n=1 Tax=Rhodococcus sp. T2V TaxID=3034164 RepID=UPI0023E0DF65|nr:hypothetical protein [Rhodococcus sp. T2V]MDF3312740.1 hypothetical protein [Rhodococcus sp. T2V]
MSTPLPRRRAGAAMRLGSAVVAVVALGLLAGGCASMRGGVEGDFERAAQQIASAAVSSQLSVTAYADGRTTVAATETALADMLEEVDQAASSTADRQVDTRDQVQLRAEVLRWADTVTGDIVRGRDIVTGVGQPADLPQVAAGLGDAGAHLQMLADRLKAAQ